MTTLQDIEKVIFATDCMIFGGYVRDMLVGDPPNDIDVWVPNKESIQKIVYGLARETPIKLDTTVEETYPHLRVLTPELEVAHIDLVTPDSLGENSLGEEGHFPDANVNRLVYSQHGIQVNRSYCPQIWNLMEVLSDIRNKVYRAEFGMDVKRHTKLQEKGWKEVSIPAY
jgi:hypothetical protein